MKRLIVLCVSLCGFSADAQTAVDPSGHWEGTIEVPGLTLSIQFDLARTASGAVAGTVDIPAENIRGLPVRVALDGRSITLRARTDQGVIGTIAPDGKTIDAEFQAGPIGIPFTLTRTGDARLEPAARHPAVTAALAGTWTAQVMTRSGEMNVVLTIANSAEGTSTGTLVNLTQGGLEIPLSLLEQKGSTVNLEMKAIGIAFAGALSESATELTGTITQAGQTTGVTFRRDDAAAAGPR